MSLVILPGHVVEDDVGVEMHGVARIRALEARVLVLEDKLRCISPDGCACHDVRVAVESVRKQQRLQEESIDALQTKSEIAGGKTASTSTKPFGLRRPHTRCMEEDCMKAEEEEPCIVYELNQSMWDAAMLLPFSRICMSDKTVIATGVFLNLVMQIFFVVIVLMDMTDSPFTAGTIEEMLQWRVESGHSRANLDVTTGQTLLQKLCKEELWTWEGEQYVTISEYLRRDVPGVYLNILAIILWVLSIMGELRAAYEQCLALFNIPQLAVDEVGLQRDADGFHISGMSLRAKVLCFMGLCLPRMTTAIFLGIVGCKYLAQTVVLADIVLNALALAFVIEVDEVMASVLLSRKIQAVLREIQPISAGYKRTASCCHPVDLLRYLMTVVFIVAAIVGYLLPFHANVVAAENALCGGQWDFTWAVGNQTVSQIILVNNTDWKSRCDQKEYLAQHYPRRHNESHVAETQESVDDFAVRMTSVLNSAFSSCQSGQILSHDVCTPIPTTLAEALPSDVMPGGNLKSPPCDRFQPQLGAGACDPPTFQVSCTWSEYSTICENNPPGSFQQQACQTDKAMTLTKSCHVWEDVFDIQHPLKNCDITRLCPANNPGCMVMIGQLVLSVSNATAFEENRTATESAILRALASVLDVLDSTVDVLQVRGWEHNWPHNAPPDRLLQDSSDFTFEGIWSVSVPRSVVVNGTALVKYAVKYLPETLLPSTIPSKTGDLTAQISANLVHSGVVVTSAAFSPWPPQFWTDDQYQRTLQNMLAPTAMQTKDQPQQLQHQQPAAAADTAGTKFASNNSRNQVNTNHAAKPE